MSRPLRVEYAGARYHVMNRGNQRQDVFKRRIDCETFLEKLEHFADIFHVEVNCYCLMSNHFHLLLRTQEANLGRFMQSFLTSFTVTLNRRNGKSGHLFQGRYKSHLVENRKYLSTLSRYIHLNPVRVRKYKNASVEDKRNILANHTWSSFAPHIGLREQPDFLDIEPVLSSWGKNKVVKMRNYRKYVEEGLYKNIDNPFDLAIRQHIIGGETFAEKIQRENILKRKVRDVREERQLVGFMKSIKPQTIIALVAKRFKIKKSELLRRKSPHRLARKLAMYFCCQYCSSHTSLTDIGKIFGVSVSGLTRSRDRVSSTKDEQEEKTIKEIKESIAKV